MAAAEIWPSDQIWKPLAAPTFAQYSEGGGFWNAVEAGDATIADLRDPMERLKTITDTYALEGWQSTQDAQTSTLLVNGQAIMATSSAGLGRLNDIAKVDPLAIIMGSFASSFLSEESLRDVIARMVPARLHLPGPGQWSDVLGPVRQGQAVGRRIRRHVARRRRHGDDRRPRAG